MFIYYMQKQQVCPVKFKLILLLSMQQKKFNYLSFHYQWRQKSEEWA